MKKTFIPLFIFGLFSLFLLRNSFVEGADNVCFCHNIDNNPETICTDNQGLINGHMGHVDDGKDTIGACVLQSSPTPTLNPSVTPSVTPTNAPQVTPSATPTPTILVQPSVTPTPTQTQQVPPSVTPTPTIAVPSPTTQPALSCALPQFMSSILGSSGINIININLLCAKQKSTSVNNTGGNVTSGNIGGGTIGTGAAGNTTTQNISGNSNSTTATSTGGGATNNVSIINSALNSIFNIFSQSNH